jgi:enolase
MAYQDRLGTNKRKLESETAAVDQDDWGSYSAMTEQMGGGDGCQIVGDDLLVTNPIRVQKAIDENSCNALVRQTDI